MKKIFTLLLIALLPALAFTKDFNPKLYNQVLEECLLDLRLVQKGKQAVIKKSIALIQNSKLGRHQKKILIAKSFLVLFDFKKAATIADELINDKNSEPEIKNNAWHIKALSARYQNQQAQSLQYLKKALTKNETDESKLFDLSIAYLLNRQPEDAIKTLKNILRINPKNIKAKIKLGSAYLNAEKPQLALNIYEKALQDKPNNSLLLYNIGHLAHHLKQTKKAITHLKKAFEANPADWLALKKLVQIYDSQSDFAQAKKYHAKILTLRNSKNAANLKRKPSYVLGKTTRGPWTIYAIYYFNKSKRLSNQTSFSIINTKNKKEEMKFNLVDEIKNNKTTYLLNIYYPNKTVKKYKSYQSLPNYETIKNDVLSCPLLSSTEKNPPKKALEKPLEKSTPKETK